jgi:3-phenylpropionate/trans-cinnamate dioxygenase ferredoxin reductase subunit
MRGAHPVNAASRKFSWYYFRAGRLIAIDSLNQSADHLTGRKLLDKGISPTPEQTADTSFDLNGLLA